MMMQPRVVGRIAVAVLAIASVPGCGDHKPAPAMAKPGPAAGASSTRSSGGGGMAGGREVKFALDGPGGITPGGTRSTNGVVEEIPAIVEFTGGKVTVEKTRVLLNGKEVAPVPEDAKVVAVDYTSSTLTITADGAQVYEAKLQQP